MNDESERSLIFTALFDLDLLVIGGDARPHALLRIKRDLGFADVIHCPTRAGDPSPRSFARSLFLPKLVLVVCARGLTRTQHGKDLHQQCRQLELPLLDCRRIPHPNKLVPAIIAARLTRPLILRSARLREAMHSGKRGAV